DAPVADAVAVGRVHIEALPVAAELLITGQQIGDVELVLDQHQTSQIVDDGARRQEPESFVIRKEYATNTLDVPPGIADSAPLDEIVNADRDIPHRPAIQFAAGPQRRVH